MRELGLCSYSGRCNSPVILINEIENFQLPKYFQHSNYFNKESSLGGELESLVTHSGQPPALLKVKIPLREGFVCLTSSSVSWVLALSLPAFLTTKSLCTVCHKVHVKTVGFLLGTEGKCSTER